MCQGLALGAVENTTPASRLSPLGAAACLPRDLSLSSRMRSPVSQVLGLSWCPPTLGPMGRVEPEHQRWAQRCLAERGAAPSRGAGREQKGQGPSPSPQEHRRASPAADTSSPHPHPHPQAIPSAAELRHPLRRGQERAPAQRGPQHHQGRGGPRRAGPEAGRGPAGGPAWRQGRLIGSPLWAQCRRLPS